MTEDRPRGLTLVKLGGSLITEKGEDATARPRVIARLARELERSRDVLPGPLVVGHGSGSFGHPPAVRHGLREGLGSPGALEGLSLTQGRAARLHRIVADSLRDAGIPVFSVAPSSAAVGRDGRIVESFVAPCLLALEEGMVPVTYGDVLLDRTRGATIASTESVLAHLAERLPESGWPVRRAVWVGDTEGVHDGEGEVIEVVRPGGEDPRLEAVGGSGAVDVTGGMAHRLETALDLARRGIPSWIGWGGPGRLADVLAGEPVPGTRVLPPEGTPAEG